MSRLVMKFGGTSVADIDRIRNVARHVRREVDAGHEVAVVVSAMAGTTNELVAWAREAAPLHDAREYDVVVASGEQVTAGLLSLALQDLGIDARSWLGWQIPIRTDGVHGKARIEAIGANNLFDVYPSRSPFGARPAAVGGVYPANQEYIPFSIFSPFGFNGRFVYGRVSLDF